ncbi:MAG: DEAD/DEAH box helicase [Planctomycetaceae bacterium]|nr:DEAD/DEAH box helicase [Planctomycetaceae bacterium]
MEKDQPKTFFDLDLSDEMLAALEAATYQEPTPIQAGLIPLALEEVDVVGQARTGTGKTAAFVIPILELLDLDANHKNPQALILVPTRELAVQVKEEVEKLSREMRITCAALYGGTPIRGQITKLKRGVEVVVGTPGRVLDHMSRNTLNLNEIDCVVLDEADRMLDVGFRPDMEKILRRCPKERQTLLLSATVPPPVERLSNKYMHEPKKLNFSSSDVTVDTIEQHYFTVDHDRKFDLLVRLLEREQPQQSIVFCRTKRGVQKVYDKLARKLKDKNIGCMHGDMQQRERNRVMAKFREENIRYMVATDVMGRGIDVSGVSHIINFDIPAFSDDYVHRVGRTGRMGREGVAFTFVTPEEGGELTKIEQRIDRLLIRDDMDGFVLTKPVVIQEPKPDDEDKRAVPSLLGRRSGQRQHRRRL